MNSVLANTLRIFSTGEQLRRVVPPTGGTGSLTFFTAIIMAFLTVFAIALSFTALRLADQWGEALAQSATLKISAPAEIMDEQVAKALEILNSTPGIKNAKVLSLVERHNLLEPWFGKDMPLEFLEFPALIDIQEENQGFNGENLRLRLFADVPGAILDEHHRWRNPLIHAAQRLSRLGLFCIILLASGSVAMIALAVRAAVTANTEVVSVLRLLGATDSYIASAFSQRFITHTLGGSLLGTSTGAAAMFFLPDDNTNQLLMLSDLKFQGAEWLWLLLIPSISGFVSFFVTRRVTQTLLRGQI